MKKLLSVLLIVTMLASMLVIVPTAVETDYTGYTKIATEADLLKFIEDVGEDGEGDMYYVLTADITLTQAWKAVECFAGVLDGNGHKITLTQPLTDSMFDLIDITAIIKNLTIDGINLSGAKEIYGFCNENKGQIWDITFTNVILASEGNDVGLINKNQKDGVISRVTATVNITGKGDRAAGLAVNNYGLIRYCTMYGTVTSNFHVGGFVSQGKNGGVVESCLNFATLTAVQSRAAGISATNEAGFTIKNCGNYGTVVSHRNHSLDNQDTKTCGIGNCDKTDAYLYENCFNAGMLIAGVAGNRIGGIAGDSKNVGQYIVNCYSLENMLYRYTDATGTTTAPITDSYVDGTDDGNTGNTNGILVTAEEFKSAEMITKLGSAFQLNTGADKDQYPIILVADTTAAPSPEIENEDQSGNDDQGGQQGGTTNPPTSGDDKNNETDYTAYTKIATEADLLKFIEDVGEDGEGDMYYVLTADITLTQAWEEVEWFAGVLDGNGHKITLTQPLTGSMFDLIDITSIIKNLTIDGINLHGAKSVYGFCNENSGQIWDVTFTNVTLASEATDVGLININQEDGVISRVTATVNITGKGDRAAGLAVNNYGLIRYCTMYGTVTSNYHVGGFVSQGKTGGVIESCLNFATITAVQSRAAGISPTNDGGFTIKNCGNYGTVISHRNHSLDNQDTKTSGIGICEKDDAYLFENCFNAGMLIAGVVGNRIGGIAAETKNAAQYIVNCYSLENMLYRYTDATGTTTEQIADSYVDGTNDGNERNTNGILVTAEEFKSAEMITKLGSAFQLNTGADKDQYPIILVADTTAAPSPEIENEDQSGNDDQGGQQGGTTNPPATQDTEPETDPETEPTTNAPAKIRPKRKVVAAV